MSTTVATRVEKDSMGEMNVPAAALYGASTARAVANFPIAHRPVPAQVIHAFGHLKAACATVNQQLGKLDANLAGAIVAAGDEIAKGKYDAEFPVDVYQTGSGTSSNMNANEVIANLCGKAGVKLHQNDHVNMGQSSNDTFPTAMHLAMGLATRDALIPSLKRFYEALDRRAKEWDHIVKVGRTHTMDATPIRMGQVFAGYAQQAKNMLTMADKTLAAIAKDMPIGGTAVGTGINTHPEFGRRVCAELHKRTGIPWQEAPVHTEAQSAADAFVTGHARLKVIAVSLTKIANDIRLLGMGPRCGIGELTLPAIQPGSSIMPGKENPVICESAMQVACRVIGNDAVVSTAGLGGIGSIFELNVAMPVIIDAIIESITLLANVCNVFVDKLLSGLKVNEKRCAELVEQSLMNVTPLAPVIGYENAAKVAKQAMAEGKTIRQIAKELKLLDDAQLEELLNFDAMTRPDKA